MVLEFILKKFEKESSQKFALGLLLMFIGFGFFLTPIYDKLYNAHVEKLITSDGLYLDKNMSDEYAKEQYFTTKVYDARSRILFGNFYVLTFLGMGSIGLMLSIISLLKTPKPN